MSDLGDLIYNRSRAYQQKRIYESQLRTTEEKSRVLRAAVEHVDDVKDSIQRLSTRTINLANVERWRGKQYYGYQGGVSRLSSAILSYAGEVDFIHDEMNIELARLKNEARDLDGLIGNVVSWIDDLCAQIENFVN